MTNPINQIIQGDSLEVLKTLPDNSIDCCISSPPYYGLRDYGVEGQLGLEKTFHEYLNKLIEIYAEVKRVIKPSGTIWVNLGDSYGGRNGNGYKQTVENENIFNGKYNNSKIKSTTKDLSKSLLNIPSRFAIKMTDELNLIQRNEIIWYKRNCMPSSARDRFTVDFEKIYFFTKSKKYYFEQITEPSTDPESYTGRKPRNAPKMASYDLKNCQVAGSIDLNGKLKNEGKTYPNRNKRCVWDVTTKPYKEAHFAVYPEDLVRPMIQAGCPVNGIVLDIFAGSGTTLKVAKEMGRNYLGIELNPSYIPLIEKRLNSIPLRLAI